MRDASGRVEHVTQICEVVEGEHFAVLGKVGESCVAGLAMAPAREFRSSNMTDCWRLGREGLVGVG